MDRGLLSDVPIVKVCGNPVPNRRPHQPFPLQSKGWNFPQGTKVSPHVVGYHPLHFTCTYGIVYEDPAAVAAGGLCAVIHHRSCSSEHQDAIDSLDVDWRAFNRDHLLAENVERYRKVTDKVFKDFDVDRDRYLCPSELKDMMIHFGERLPVTSCLLPVIESSLTETARITHRIGNERRRGQWDGPHG